MNREPSQRAEPMGSLRDQTVRGWAVNLANQLITGLLNYAVQLILAWKLSPKDFGLVAVASAVAGIVGVFRDAGTTKVLVQRHREFDEIAGAVFRIGAWASITCAVLTASVAPALAWAYGEPRLTAILWVMSLRFPLSALSLVADARLVSDLRFRAQAVVQLALAILSAVLSILLASFGAGVWAIVFPRLVADAAAGPIYWSVVGTPWSAKYRRKAVKELLAQSRFVLGGALILAVRGQIDYLILGLIRTVQETGLYFVAFLSAGMGGRFLVGSLNAVLFPVLARFSHEHERFEAAYARSLHLAAFLVLPLMCAQVLAARLLFEALLDPRWHPAALYFAILSVMNAFVLLDGPIVQSMHAAGRFATILRFDTVFVAFEVCLFAIGAWIGGATGLCVAGAVSGVVGFLALHVVCLRELRFRWSKTIRPLWCFAVALIPMGLVGTVATAVAGEDRLRREAAVVLALATGLAAFLSLLRALWPDLLREIVDAVRMSGARWLS